jgi:hypothetical protein
MDVDRSAEPLRRLPISRLEALLDDRQAHAAVGVNFGIALDRTPGVDGHIGATGAKRSQHRGDVVARATDVETDAGARLDAQPTQSSGDAIRESIARSAYETLPRPGSITAGRPSAAAARPRRVIRSG